MKMEINKHILIDFPLSINHKGGFMSILWLSSHPPWGLPLCWLISGSLKTRPPGHQQDRLGEWRPWRGERTEAIDEASMGEWVTPVMSELCFSYGYISVSWVSGYSPSVFRERDNMITHAWPPPPMHCECIESPPAECVHYWSSSKVWKGMSRDYELEHRFENLIKKVRPLTMRTPMIINRWWCCGSVRSPPCRILYLFIVFPVPPCSHLISSTLIIIHQSIRGDHSYICMNPPSDASSSSPSPSWTSTRRRVGSSSRCATRGAALRQRKSSSCWLP